VTKDSLVLFPCTNIHIERTDAVLQLLENVVVGIVVEDALVDAGRHFDQEGTKEAKDARCFGAVKLRRVTPQQSMIL
jgi:hypothetical protein